jgi:hypothetical protein
MALLHVRVLGKSAMTASDRIWPWIAAPIPLPRLDTASLGRGRQLQALIFVVQVSGTASALLPAQPFTCDSGFKDGRSCTR